MSSAGSRGAKNASLKVINNATRHESIKTTEDTTNSEVIPYSPEMRNMAKTKRMKKISKFKNIPTRIYPAPKPRFHQQFCNQGFVNRIDCAGRLLPLPRPELNIPHQDYRHTFCKADALLSHGNLLCEEPFDLAEA